MRDSSADGRRTRPERGGSMTLDELEVLIGDWNIAVGGGEAWPDMPPIEEQLASGVATVSFEWMEGREFVVQRWTAPDPGPDGLAVIGPDPEGDGYLQHYFDERGVARVYKMTPGLGHLEAVARRGRFLATRLQPALHRHLQRRRKPDRGHLGDQRGRRLGQGLRPDLRQEELGRADALGERAQQPASPPAGSGPRDRGRGRTRSASSLEPDAGRAPRRPARSARRR